MRGRRSIDRRFWLFRPSTVDAGRSYGVEPPGRHIRTNIDAARCTEVMMDILSRRTLAGMGRRFMALPAGENHVIRGRGKACIDVVKGGLDPVEQILLFPRNVVFPIAQENFHRVSKRRHR